MGKMRLAVFASGRGSNLQAIIQATKEKDFPAEIVVVHSDNPEALALKRATSEGIPLIVLDPKNYVSKKEYEQELFGELRKYQPDFIVLAGYMRILSNFLLQKFPYRIINIHPSLLPSFPGLEAQKQALDYGVKVSGCTVHFVDQGVDSGPIILQKAVPVLEDDTVEDLAQRILEQEHIIYPRAIKLIAQNRVVVSGRKVMILDHAGRTKEVQRIDY